METNAKFPVTERRWDLNCLPGCKHPHYRDLNLMFCTDSFEHGTPSLGRKERIRYLFFNILYQKGLMIIKVLGH